MSEGTGHSDRRLNRAALLRAAADGELDSVQERHLEVLLEAEPGDAARIECECLLREALGRVCSVDAGAPAPEGLRERVLEAMRCEDLDEVSPMIGGVPEQMADRTRSVSFWAGAGRKAMLSVAALLLLSASLMWFSRSREAIQVLRDRTAAASFVATEHGNCINDLAHAREKFAIQDPAELPAFAGSVVGKEIALADLIASGASNINFLDAGRCSVPSGGPSMHLQFSLPEQGSDVVSLFIQRDGGRLGLEEGVAYELDPGAGGSEPIKSPCVYLWLREGLVYYLVIEDTDDNEVLRQTLDVPAETRMLTSST
ncbi:MAG TPA: hypothetical protein ENJ00_04690 [Phycisphaerales bacterium]|nr:hypothetical protein [Phycisphaerales bacterium]